MSFNPFTIIAKEFITYPIYNILFVFLLFTKSNLGRSIIGLTLVIRLLLMPVTSSGNDMTKHMAEIQPKLQEIQEKYKDDPEKLSQKTMELMKTQGMGPLKGCLSMLVQLPLFIGLYNIVKTISDTKHIHIDNIYSFRGQYIGHLAPLDTMRLGLDMLAKSSNSNLILAVISGILMMIQMKMTQRVNPTPAKSTAQKLPGGQEMPDMSSMMSMFTYIMPVMIGVVVYNTQAGVGLYILTTTLFGVLQFVYQYRAVLSVKFGTIFGRKSV